MTPRTLNFTEDEFKGKPLFDIFVRPSEANVMTLEQRGRVIDAKTEKLRILSSKVLMRGINSVAGELKEIKDMIEIKLNVEDLK